MIQADSVAPFVGGLLILALFAVWAGSLAFWIITLVEVARIPDDQYRRAGTEKTPWVLLVVLAQVVGALIWRFSRRTSVLAARSSMPQPPPAGWYPEPVTGQLRHRWRSRRWSGCSAPAGGSVLLSVPCSHST